ncbi:uncharacterized protein B0H18DRAFT_970045 [Fomitopsis serialis]|uniref:uncharacterized protein n=1 Tax=Fomitopsis serialis TaxID=139415 RepID=UPI00200807EF|nr:uncharacterized protein B0H18DRAFT_970045 [Neoantrodia serialis]KAH9937312.1 hypothetical protein B0H18DRAFT_970045 [Neoantrodia serialis]
MPASFYQFPSSVFRLSAESSGRSWPMYDARQPRTRKAGTFGSRGQAAAIHVRKRLQKEKQEHRNTNEQVKAEGPRKSFSREAADALAIGNVSRALQLQQRAQVAASFASGLVSTASEPRSPSLHISGRSSPTASLVSLSGDSGYEETLGSILPRTILMYLCLYAVFYVAPVPNCRGVQPFHIPTSTSRTMRTDATPGLTAQRASRARNKLSLTASAFTMVTGHRKGVRLWVSSLLLSNSSQTSAGEPCVLPLTRRLAPLPRFDPFMRTRSESLSSIIHAPNTILTGRTDLVCFTRSVRKCKTTGNIKGAYRLDVGHMRCQ